MNSKKANNDIERSSNSIKEIKIKSERLNDAIEEARQDCNELRLTLNTLRTDNVNASNSIASETSNCNKLDGNCKLYKNNLLLEEKMKTNLKGELIKEQKVMTSCSILTKELEHERAVLLLAINQSVATNKLQ